MKSKRFSRTLALALCAVMVLSLMGGLGLKPQTAAAEQPECTIIPLPVSYLAKEGTYTLTAQTRFVITAEDADQKIAASMEAVASELRKSTGYALPVVKGEAQTGDIAAVIDSTLTLGDEGYTLNVAPDMVTVTAKNAGGIFYGLQTLRQLLPGVIESDTLVEGVAWTAPCAEVEDEPRFSYRSFQLDVSRHFFGVDEVKRQIDHMAMYKINTLHLHLADDQGWRLEIKNNGQVDKEGNPVDYSRLTTIGGSTSCSTNGIRPGFYTQEQLKDIVAYAAARNVQIVPEFDMPAHAWAALVSLPMLNSTEDGKPHVSGYDNTKPYEGQAVGWASLECRNENTFLFVEEVIKQVSEICPSPYFHIGGDEAHVTSHEDYVYFVNRVTDIAQKYGKTPIGWQNFDQVTDDPQNTYTQFWGGDQHCRPGIKYVLSPNNKIYMDMQYDNKDTIGLHWAGYVPVKKSYDWDPSQYGTEEQILGIEAPIWTETFSEPEHLDYMFFPRSIGAAEIGWTAKALRPAETRWNSYRTRLALQKDRLDSLEIGYREDPSIWTKPLNFRMPFDEGVNKQKVVRDTEGGHVLELPAGVTNVAGKFGGGLHFDGHSYLNINEPDMGTEWTIGMWVKAEDNGNHNATLIGGSQGDLKLEQYENTGKVGVTIYGVQDYTFNYSAPMGEWVHLTFVSGSGKTTLYVNGVKQDELNVSLNGPVTRLGANAMANNKDRGAMKGTLDDLQVYSRALTAEEVLEMVKDPFDMGESLALSFTDAQGKTVTDDSGLHTFNVGRGVSFVEGANGTGINLDGSGSLKLGFRDLGNQWTAAMWVKRGHSLFDNTTLISGYMGDIKLEQWPDTKKVGLTGYKVEDKTYNYSTTEGEWVHIAMVSDGTKTSLYVNGQLNEEIPFVINGPAMYLGQNNAISGLDRGYATAALDEVRLFNKALTADEVQGIVGAGDLAKAEELKAQLQTALQNPDQYAPETLEGVDALIAEADALKGKEIVTVNQAAKLEAQLQAAVDGLTPAAKKINVSSVNMTLGNELSMNFMVKKSDVTDLTGLSLQITKTFADGREPVVVTVPAESWKDYSKEYYAVKFTDISAKEMTDEITAVVLKDGKPAGDVYTESVEDYALRVLRGEQATAQLKAVIVDMLNYGAEAQKYFEYHLDVLANANLTVEEKALASAPIKAQNVQVKGDRYFGSNLNLGNSMTMTVYFKGITPDMHAVVSYTKHTGEKKEIPVNGADFVRYNDTVYGVRVSTLVVADAQQPVTVTVYDANNQVAASGTDSIASYVARSTTVGELGQAILKLASSAEVYFANR